MFLSVTMPVGFRFFPYTLPLSTIAPGCKSSPGHMGLPSSLRDVCSKEIFLINLWPDQIQLYNIGVYLWMKC